MAAGERVREFDFVRVLSMLAVIMIHVTAPYLGRDSAFTVLGMNLAFLLNQVSRFAVPMFVLLSGASLGFSRSAGGLAGFYRKRALKIGVPYLCWFSIYYGYELAHTAETARFTVGGFLSALLQGQSAPHLYFIVVIAQLYLLYPLLKRAVDRAPKGTLLFSLLCTSAMELLLALRRAGLDYIPGFLQHCLWLLFPTWIFYFVLGMTLTAERVEALRRFSGANAGWLIPAAAVFAFGYVVQSQVFHALDSMKLLLNLYVPVVLLAAFALWQSLGGVRWVQRAVAFLSAHAMTVYFCHVLVVYRFRDMGRFCRGMAGMAELYVLVVLLSVPLAWLLDTAGEWAVSGMKKRKRR